MADRAKSNSKNSLLALFFVAILGVMLVPVPGLLLDAMLCLNITSSLLILMAVLNAGRPVEFSTFPSVLLFTALFRLVGTVKMVRHTAASPLQPRGPFGLLMQIRRVVAW